MLPFYSTFGFLIGFLVLLRQQWVNCFQFFHTISIFVWMALCTITAQCQGKSMVFCFLSFRLVLQVGIHICLPPLILISADQNLLAVPGLRDVWLSSTKARLQPGGNVCWLTSAPCRTCYNSTGLVRQGCSAGHFIEAATVLLNLASQEFSGFHIHRQQFLLVTPLASLECLF